jgi:hypothetical protein
MATVIEFPIETRLSRSAREPRREKVSAQIIVLPVVRMERWATSEPVLPRPEPRTDLRSN